MSDEYDLVARGKLKLKTDSISSKDKKKKKKEKKRERERLERGVRQEQETIDEEVRANAAPKGATMTKAEMSFKKMQQKMVSFAWLWLLPKSTPKNWQFFLGFSSTARQTHFGEGIDDSQAEGGEIQWAFG